MRTKNLFIPFLILAFHPFVLKGASIDERVNEVLSPISNTVAGLVFYESRTIPKKGQVFSFFDLKFEILSKKNNQITLVKIIK